MKHTRFPALLLFLLLFSASPVSAAHYALLVGVADYPHAPKLFGPTNDVASLMEVLSTRYDFPSGNITTLLNGQATKKNILQALSDLKHRSHKGDFIFFYFSGHGTSAYDREASLSMDNTTGAIVPYDFDAVPGNPRKTLERLIIGRRDLQPILLELDRDRTLFVVFDSCYSGNAVRAIRTGRGIPKFVPLDIPADTATFSAIKDIPFPYTSLVYFAAAHQTETADDLRPEDTHDGRSHGALTDALLVGLRGDADMNHDGTITYEELYDFSRQKMQTVARHTPQVKSNRPLSTPLFERGVTITPIPPAESSAELPPLRVQVSGSAATLAGALSRLSGIILVAEKPDLRITTTGDLVSLMLPGGDILCTVTGTEEAGKRVERYARSRELLALKNPRQDFNVFLRPLGDQGKTVFHQGEQLGLQVTSEAEAHLLLLDIDPQGYVTLLLPNATDDNRIRLNAPLTLSNIGEIEPPLGVEFLKLFAFRTPVSGLTPFLGRSLSPVGPEFSQLISIIRRQQGWSSTTMEVVTMEN
jgi:hypothetical protein